MDRVLEDAYRGTSYEVLTDPPIVLRVDEQNAALAELHRAHRCRSSAFLTAWNPLSQEPTPAENAERQALLRASVEEKGFKMIDGVGASTTDDWPPEESLLVLGIDRDTAATLGVQFEQNAIVWAGEDAVPRLLILV
ncbi:MAG: DUF3293 domain-containing protein [Pseudomonadales bacterium]|jgi:hypothetical protein|nr:DUF3293 domain-containing protein [Pseudomonadales bacterium]